MQVFATAYPHWVDGDDGADLRELTDAAMALLRTLLPADLSGPSPAGPRPRARYLP
jgi:hypothetical protein